MNRYFRLVIALLVICVTLSQNQAVYAQEPTVDKTVDKTEFNEKWAETYKELQAIDPTAAEAFRAETMKAFQDGEIGYAASRETAGTEAATGGASTGDRGTQGRPQEGTTAGSPAGAGPGYRAGPAPTEGPRGTGQYGPVQTGPAGPMGPAGPYGATYGPGPTSTMGPGPMDRTTLEGKFSDKDLKKIDKAFETLEKQSAKIDWGKLTPEQADGKRKELEARFEKMTGGININEVMGPPPSGAYGPMGPEQGPGPYGAVTPYGPAQTGPAPMGPAQYGPAGTGQYGPVQTGPAGPMGPAGPYGATYGPGPEQGPGPYGAVTPYGPAQTGPAIMGPSGPHDSFGNPMAGPVEPGQYGGQYGPSPMEGPQGGYVEPPKGFEPAVPPTGFEPPVGFQPPTGFEPPVGFEPPAGFQPPAGPTFEPPPGAYVEPPKEFEPPPVAPPPPEKQQ